MITSSADLPGNFGCGSTGMPRPLSMTVKRFSRLQRDLDPRCMSCDCFIHRIVDHFGGKVMQRALVGPADIHAGTPPDGLEPLQHLDRGCIVITRIHAPRRSVEQIAHRTLLEGEGLRGKRVT